ncbi:hypothetical protein PM082_019729 [Marasmius tenuissimus]|nr:hypothetical protein PM082_019729 [Marasmius tenuissimus]
MVLVHSCLGNYFSLVSWRMAESPFIGHFVLKLPKSRIFCRPVFDVRHPALPLLVNTALARGPVSKPHSSRNSRLEHSSVRLQHLGFQIVSTHSPRRALNPSLPSCLSSPCRSSERWRARSRTDLSTASGTKSAGIIHVPEGIFVDAEMRVWLCFRGEHVERDGSSGGGGDIERSKQLVERPRYSSYVSKCWLRVWASSESTLLFEWLSIFSMAMYPHLMQQRLLYLVTITRRRSGSLNLQNHERT